MNRNLFSAVVCLCSFGFLLTIVGCGKSSDDGPRGVLEPKVAASHLQQAFTTAPEDIQQNATAASEALRSANYEQAILSLQAMTVRKDLTYDQGKAVYDSMAALEAKLIAAAAAGDERAKQTYELLKRSRRN